MADDTPTDPAPGPLPPRVVEPPAPPAGPGLAEGLGDFFRDLRSSGVWNPRIALAVLAVAAIAGAYWYKTSADRRASSGQWAMFERATTPAALAEVASAYPDAPVGRLARLDAARRLFGPEGVGLFTSRDKEPRDKAADNVAAARDEFRRLADEFPDLTLKAEALRGAAESELALVGIPGKGKDGESRGSVETAADLFAAAGRVAGETTPVGEKLLKWADELKRTAPQVLAAGRDLYRAVAPASAGDDIKPPAANPFPNLPPVVPVGPRPPTGPVVEPKPPASLVPAPPPARTPDPAVSPIQPQVPQPRK